MKCVKVSDNTYVIALSQGEDIMRKLMAFLGQAGITNAYFQGIGALQKAELAHYRLDTKKYSTKEFEEPLELTNLTGNVFLYEGKPLIHAHATLGNDAFGTFSGHLVNGVVSSICEIILTKMDSTIEKKHSPAVGLKVLSL